MSLSNSNSHSSDLDSLPESYSNPLEDLEIVDLFERLTMVVPELKTEYLNMVPVFSGEPEFLPRFLEISGKLVARFYDTENPNNFQNEFLMSSILSRIKGKAAEVIASSQFTTWNDLKSCLINGFADKRDCFTLGVEMVELKQNSNESPFDYLTKVQKQLNLQIAYHKTHFTAIEEPIVSKYASVVAVRVFLRGLKEPLGSLMRTKNPKDLNEALSMLTNDFQWDAKQSKSVQPPKNFHQPRPITFNKNPTNQTFSAPRAITYPSSNQIRPFTNPGFSRNRPNFNTQRNVFQPNPNSRFSKPTPMSISTRNTFRPNQSTNQYTNTPMVVEELLNIDENDQIENTNYPDQIQFPTEDTDHFLEEPASPDLNS